MKTLPYFFIILTLMSFFACEKAVSPLDAPSSEFSSRDDSGISDSIRSLYKSDAAYLAFRHIYANKMSDTAQVNIPQQWIDTFYDGLIRIYNCTSIPAIDTITSIYPVHVFPYQSLYCLIVGFDTSYSWTKRWENGFTLTGNDSIDSLITKYNLELAGRARYRSALLITKTPLNMWALGRAFNQVSGVRYAEPDGFSGSGNDIIATLNLQDKHYTFTVGWGDCPAGCIHRRFWEYSVSSAGRVNFLGSYGDVID